MRRHCEGVAFFDLWKEFGMGGVSLEPPKESENMPLRNVPLSFIADVFGFCQICCMQLHVLSICHWGLGSCVVY